jgi:site-specific recombinase XerD
MTHEVMERPEPELLQRHAHLEHAPAPAAEIATSLLTQLSFWESQPLEAFSDYLGSKMWIVTSTYGQRKTPEKMEASSRKVYMSVFNTFIKWVKGQEKTLLEVTSADIEKFIVWLSRRRGGVDDAAISADRATADALAGKRLSASAIKRHVRCVERVYEYLIRIGGPTENPVSPAICKYLKTLKDEGKDLVDTEPLNFFSDAQQAALAKAIRAAMASDDWLIRRDGALCAFLLGSGCRLIEARDARACDLSKDGRTVHFKALPHLGVKDSRTSYVRGHMLEFVAGWLDDRWRVDFNRKYPKAVLFPKNPAAAALDDLKDVEYKMDRRRVWEGLKRIFHSAGITDARVGARFLRSSFAVTSIIDKPEVLPASLHAVRTQMGIKDDESMLVYTEALRSIKTKREVITNKSEYPSGREEADRMMRAKVGGQPPSQR